LKTLYEIISKGKEKMVPIISAGAMLGAFANLASDNFFNAESKIDLGSGAAIATFAGCIIMMLLTKLAKEKNIKWLKEWAFAISMFLGMFIGYLCK
jgi:fluoride ion exporter CrcB/FEX